MSVSSDFKWWQRGVIYQVYPRSFLDTNGDGVGDLPGVTAGLDYLSWLGVDAIWLSPINPSPMADFGYDVSDYTAIDPVFGTLEDFDRLVRGAHARSIKLILDFVPNHTSEQHPWFRESRRSRDNPKRDWYIWRDAAPGGGPPTNWLSEFGGSAWEWDERTGQYYYHAFLKEQPDLNWRNPDVQEAMFAAMRFWLDRGADGFRVDVASGLIKDDRFRDNPPNPDYEPSLPPHHRHLRIYNSDRPEVHDIIARMRHLLDQYPDRMMIGEIYLPVERLVTYYGTGGDEAHLPFNFRLIRMPWDARKIGDAVARYEALLPPHGWPNWVLGNHDRPRIATRVGPAQARVAAMLLLTLRGTPTLYYGDELGMQNVPIPPDRVQDPFEKNVPGRGFGRDPVRTPMQWSPEPHAGFTSGRPWLPLSADHDVVNVATERDGPRSMLSLYRRLIELRRASPALSVGSYRALTAPDGVLCYEREFEGQRMIVALNLTGAPQVVTGDSIRGTLLVSTGMDRGTDTIDGELHLREAEGVVLAVHGSGWTSG